RADRSPGLRLSAGPGGQCQGDLHRRLRPPLPSGARVVCDRVELIWRGGVHEFVEATLRRPRARAGAWSPAAETSPMSIAERLLIARPRQREEAALHEVVRLHGDKVFNLVLRMVGTRAEAEDIAQEVFVTVFKNIHTFTGASKLTTSLRRIAR